jgi:lysophospholipase L1-like esterase
MFLTLTIRKYCLYSLAVLSLTVPVFAEAPMASEQPRTPEEAVTPKENIPKQRREDEFLKITKDKSIQLVFLGDSITDWWLRDDGQHGKEVWDQHYAKWNAVNFGISGERTEHTLGHIAKGILDNLHPKVVVIMIGTNNIGQKRPDKPEWAAAGVKKVVESVQEKLPNSKILLLGVFPRSKKDSPLRNAVNEINAIICKLDNGNSIRYLDIGPKFIDAEGNIPKDVIPDALHPSTKGYQIWAESMNPLLNEMMQESAN